MQDNKIWLSEKFTRGQAWVDMLILANHKTGYIRKRGILIKVERGQLGHGEEFLAKRWSWSRGKVRRYIDELILSGQAVRRTGQKNITVNNCIEIVNYDKYQQVGTQLDTQDGTQGSTEDGQKTDSKRYRNKNDKNKKNDKKTTKIFVRPTIQQIQEYCNERNNGLSGQLIFDSYQAKGWKIGKTPMKDWKAAVRTWEKNGHQKPDATEQTKKNLTEWVNNGSSHQETPEPETTDIEPF